MAKKVERQGDYKMKYCAYCGAAVEDGAMFCPNCGSALSNQSPENQNSAFPSVSPAPVPATPAPAAAKRKLTKRQKLALILVPILLVAVIAAGIGIFALVKANSSPMLRIGGALKELFASGDAYSYTVSGSMEEGDDTFRASGDLKIDLDEKSIELRDLELVMTDGYMGSEGDSYEINVEEAFLHCDESEFAAKVTAGGAMHFGAYGIDEYRIYNNLGMYYGEGKLYGAEEWQTRAELESLLSACSTLFDLATGEISADEASAGVADDLEELFPEEDDAFDDLKNRRVVLDPKVLNQAKKELIRCLTDAAWLEENLGMTTAQKGGLDVYSFDIDIRDAVEALAAIAEPILADLADQVLEVTGEEWDYRSDLEYLLDDLPTAEDLGVNAVFKLDGRSFSAFELELTEDGDVALELEITAEQCDDFTAVDGEPWLKDVEEVRKMVNEF